MLARLCSAAANGIGASSAHAEVNIGRGDTVTVVVVLPDAAVNAGFLSELR